MSEVSTSSLPTVGFIGLGKMGSGMTANLQLHGYPLMVNDLDPQTAVQLLPGGAMWCATPSEVAARSDLVITMLPTPRHVSDVALGRDGILEGIADGGTWIDMSTSVPDVTNAVRGLHPDRGIRYVDAPVSGMSIGAATGKLQIFVGADRADFVRLVPIFEAMGDPQRIMHVGGNGAGYAVKLMLNQLWFSHLVATAEVMAVGVRAGVDLGVLRDALIASPANSNFVQHDVRSILDSGDYDEGFALALACKDLGLSIDLARAVGVSTELSALVEQVFRRARATYGDRAGEMSPFKLYEDLIGRELRLVAAVDTPTAALAPNAASVVHPVVPA